MDSIFSWRALHVSISGGMNSIDQESNQWRRWWFRTNIKLQNPEAKFKEHMSFYKTNFFDPQSAAEKVVSVIRNRYELTSDIRLIGCKPNLSDSTLIDLKETLTKDLLVSETSILWN
ncbi:hypothetical protein L6452_23026 [Arctium lappa]|uniref:Uncharacterized protein n=1 Tax=Arctium lappa TaxID=4217 RepID=A0ACB9B0W4_ARCLA|nr:hypothetical protein L6452_23026 [Arctium lappa]